MADVQVAVGLGREAGVDLRVFLLGDVGGDNVADEIGGSGAALRLRRRIQKLYLP